MKLQPGTLVLFRDQECVVIGSDKHYVTVRFCGKNYTFPRPKKETKKWMIV
ncbi:MAG: hypothetical protein WC196_05640 [Bacilli bacterium]